MYTLLSVVLAVLRLPEQRDRDEAYLARAESAQDLERRQRALDRRGRPEWTLAPQGQWFEQSV